MNDYILSTYNTLLDDGWRMKDVDDMDFIGFLHVRAYKAGHNRQTDQHEDDKPAPGGRMAIDQAFPGLI